MVINPGIIFNLKSYTVLNQRDKVGEEYFSKVGQKSRPPRIKVDPPHSTSSASILSTYWLHKCAFLALWLYSASFWPLHWGTIFIFKIVLCWLKFKLLTPKLHFFSMTSNFSSTDDPLDKSNSVVERPDYDWINLHIATCLCSHNWYSAVWGLCSSQ